MDLRSRLTLQWLGYFSLVLLPAVLALGLFLFDRVLSQSVLVGSWILAVFGTFMAFKMVETMRGLRDDDKTRQWLHAAGLKDAATATAKDRDESSEKLLDELRGRKDARLPPSCTKPAHWRGLDDAALQGQVARLLKKLGRRVQRTGDSAHRGFDLVVDNNAIVQCGADSKKAAHTAAQDLLRNLRAHPACTAAILVWPKGLPARTRHLARGTNLIIWDADNIARLVQDKNLA
jgi:hypothetical protein